MSNYEAERAMNEPSPSDTEIVDHIATLLGTSREWRGADHLEEIATLISYVRPFPAGDPDEYVANFECATGREVPALWDRRDED